ncbi:MAG: S8 family serine peptidase [Actinomycetota bacterium]
MNAESDDGPPPAAEETGRFVVILEDEPLVTEFGTDGVDSAAAKARAAEFSADQDAVAAAAGLGADAIANKYTVALNGFAAEMTASQVARAKATDGVLMVLEDFMRQPQTDSSLDFLGLTGQGEAHRSGLTGEGVVVGIIDSGIWPEHPSFADDGSYSDLGIVLDETVYPACEFGNTAQNPLDAPFECNNKLLGARNIAQTYRAVVGADPTEFDSARDDDGHGSHTASTAAGNANVEAQVGDRKLGKISGVAPRARVIAYKACGVLGCFTSDLAAAIDQAVLDGVDVINYSIGGGAGDVGPDEIAFLFAADAGVHVATSAGNSGPGPATVGDPATKPWLTSVGASTQPRFFAGEVRFNANVRFRGASLTAGLGRTEFVDAEFAGGDLCQPGTLDPAAVDGKIVLCRRGAIARAAKSLAVFQAGGAGMVLYNNTDNDNLFTDPHSVPSVHLNNTDGLALKQYIADRPSARAVITIVGTTKFDPAPSMTIFSSRGPNAVAGDIIKPDLTAPGFQVLAAYSPVATPDGSDFAAIAGTSMSSPHVAGLMALLDQAHPDWSAGAVKSALMTTAHQDVVKDDQVTPADPFDFGAGHVDVGLPRRHGSAFQPGLVYEAGFLDYLGFLCDVFPEELANPAATCSSLAGIGIAITAVDLNYPSIGVSSLAGSQTITRTVTSVADEKHAVMYRPIVDAPDGYEVEVTPSTMKLMPGQSATFQVTITNVSAPVGEWRHGSLTWAGGNYKVYSPISVRGVSLAAPAQVDATGVDGEASVPVTFGYTGDYTAAGHGLEAATIFSGTVAQDPDQTFDPTDGFSNLHQITTSGAAALLVQMPPEATEAAADIDIYVLDSSGNLVASSTAGGTAETIALILPADDTYDVWVHGWSAPGGDSPYDLYTWVISATPGGSLVVDGPSSVTVGETADLGVSWTGAAAGEWHIGAVSHSDGAGLLGLTLINVDNR